MKCFLLGFCLVFSLAIKSQDEIITKDYQYDPDPSLKIISVTKDTVTFLSKGKFEKISSEKVVAIRRKGSRPQYIKPSDERIYGVKLGNAFFKADYRFSTDIQPELSKLYFMEKFRVYDSVIEEKVTRQIFIINNETGEKVKLPSLKGFFIYFKDDQLHREIKGKIHFTTTDSTQLIIRSAISGDTYTYFVNERDIEAIGIQSDGALAGRIALGAVSQGAAGQFYQNRWLTKYDFSLWHLGW
ncbi:MAG: hypothetical protein V4565_05675 [Bacteroidota bacterium]